MKRMRALAIWCLIGFALFAAVSLIGWLRPCAPTPGTLDIVLMRERC